MLAAGSLQPFGGTLIDRRGRTVTGIPTTLANIDSQCITGGNRLVFRAGVCRAAATAANAVVVMRPVKNTSRQKAFVGVAAGTAAADGLNGHLRAVRRHGEGLCRPRVAVILVAPLTPLSCGLGHREACHRKAADHEDQTSQKSSFVFFHNSFFLCFLSFFLSNSAKFALQPIVKIYVPHTSSKSYKYNSNSHFQHFPPASFLQNPIQNTQLYSF